MTTTFTHQVNDLVEDNEGDKGVVAEVRDDGAVRVTWDCSGRTSDFLSADTFSNLTERVTGRKD